MVYAAKLERLTHPSPLEVPEVGHRAAGFDVFSVVIQTNFGPVFPYYVPYSFHLEWECVFSSSVCWKYEICLFYFTGAYS